MPKIDKKSTLARQWEMLRMLTPNRSDTPEGGRWDKASEIAAQLKDKGYEVSVRTVQRDLQELSELFPIELNDKNPRDYGWRWVKGASLDLPGMTVSEALAMRLVETHLRELMPESMLEGMQGIFSLAQTKLAKIGNKKRNYGKDWLNKVRVVPPTQPLLPPLIDPGIQSSIYLALLENWQIKAIYQPMSSSQPKEYLLHPLGLVMRGAVTYLVASARDYDKALLFALHRFSKVEVLKTAAKVPKDFSLDLAISKGLAEFSIQDEPIKLAILCSKKIADYLTETPLSADQNMATEPDGRIRLTATVNNTWELRKWLMGRSDELEVYAPVQLRANIKAALVKAASQYN